MAKNILKLLSTGVCASFFLFSQHTSAQEVTIDFDTKMQTIDGMGINFEGYHRTAGSDILKSSLVTMLDIMPMNMVRIGMPIKEWEPTNDNDDPTVIDESAFVTTGSLAYSFSRLQRVKEDYGYDIWLSIWDMADWNITNSSSSYNRNIADFDEFAESITAYLLHAKNEYGVEVAWVSVNEPSIASENGWGGYDLGLSAEEQATLIKTASRYFEENGLTTKWMVAVHSIYASELEQAKAIYEDEDTRPYIAGFDFHSYGLQKSSREDDLKNWGDWIATTGLPSWCGELDYDNSFWEVSTEDKKLWITHGMITAGLYASLVNDARISAGFPWYAHSPSSTTPYRYACLHYHAHFLPGDTVVATTSSNEKVLTTATTNGDNWTLIIQNYSSQSREVTITGVTGTTAQAIVSYNNNYGVRLDDIEIVDGVLTLVMQPYSLYSIGTTLDDIETTIVTEGGNADIPENYIEAEDGEIGGGSSIGDSQSGYTGTGYVDYGAKDSWNSVELYLDEDATYYFFACYASGSSRPCDVYVNDELVGAFAYPSTGGFTTWLETSIPIDFKAGTNTVKIIATAATGGPNVDYYRWDTSSGIASSTSSMEITAAPNPTTDFIYVKGCDTTFSYTISNLQGQTLLGDTCQECDKGLDVSSLPTGIYVLDIITTNKKQRAVQRIVKL